MNKALWKILVLLVLLAFMTAGIAFADDFKTEYQSEFFCFSFGDAFEDQGNMMGSGVLYARVNANPLIGSFIVDEREMDADTDLMTEAQLTALYDRSLSEFIGEDEESADAASIEIEGKEARVFNYTLTARGMSFPAAACIVMHGNRMLIVSYFVGPSGSPEEVREKVLEAGGTIRYLGK